MAQTQVESGNEIEQWEDDFDVEFIRDNLFKRFMGRGPNSIVQVNYHLEGSPGVKLTHSLLTKLSGDPVIDDDMLEGNEEEGANYSHQTTVHQYRKAVRAAKYELKKTHLELMNGYRELLLAWASENIRDLIIDAQHSANVDGVTPYDDCTAAQRNAWLTANSDRVLVGAAKANAVSNVLATALALVDATNDTLSVDMLELAYRIARTASPAIRPWRFKEDEEWYVFFAESLGFRDLKSSPAYQQGARDGWTRGEDNPLFRPGDIQWGGMMIREIPEYSGSRIIEDAGDGATVDVGISVLAGAQDVLLDWADKTHAFDDVFDYGNQRGFGVGQMLACERATYKDDKQHGQVTVFHAAEADT